jgi:transposase
MNREARRCASWRRAFQRGGIAETARQPHTARNLIRKRVQRHHEEGAPGLEDRSRRPHRCPTKTMAEIEAMVPEAKERPGYGRKRLAWYLWQEEGLALSPHTIRHILYRNGFHGGKAKRKTLYPAHFRVGGGAAVHVGSGGCARCARHGDAGEEALGSPGETEAPRCRWTFLGERTRIRFLPEATRWA